MEAFVLVISMLLFAVQLVSISGSLRSTTHSHESTKVTFFLVDRVFTQPLDARTKLCTWVVPYKAPLRDCDT